MASHIQNIANETIESHAACLLTLFRTACGYKYLRVEIFLHGHMSSIYPTTASIVLHKAYHKWLNNMRHTLQYALDDFLGRPYEAGALRNRWMAWYEHSKRNGASAHNFTTGTDCYNTIIMPAIHQFRGILDAIESSDLSFYRPSIRPKLLRVTQWFEEEVEKLLGRTRRGAFAMGMMDLVGASMLVDKIRCNSII